MTNDLLPPGWDEERIRRVLEHYETQSDEEAAAEDEDRHSRNSSTIMEVPTELVPVIRKLISSRKAV
ncbi:MAG: hypothetical protein ACR2FO_02315 [Actinomycetota bacterium]